MRRPSKLSISCSVGVTKPDRSRPPTAERVRRRRSGARVQTSAASLAGAIVSAIEPSDPKATPPARPEGVSTVVPSTTSSELPARLTTWARRVRA